MANEQTTALDVLNVFGETTDILLKALAKPDLDKAHEAISVLLMQGMEMFGREHPLMCQFFPVWDAIKSHIDSDNVERALSQTITWKKQLAEVKAIVNSA
jgi:hypothetical protein